MRLEKEYHIAATTESLREFTDFIYSNVFRTDFSVSGFVVIDLGPICTSENLREAMVHLKKDLSHQHFKKTNQCLFYQWMGRFDQQETTRFHLDNAADQSFLMLGYEPSMVQSKLFFADYLLLIDSLGITPETYYKEYSPMTEKGENLLFPYSTEVKSFDNNSYKIVLLNNSNTESASITKGIVHKAEITNKDPDKSRIINSIMLYSANCTERKGHEEDEEQNNFVTTSLISRK